MRATQANGITLRRLHGEITRRGGVRCGGSSTGTTTTGTRPGARCSCAPPPPPPPPRCRRVQHPATSHRMVSTVRQMSAGQIGQPWILSCCSAKEMMQPLSDPPACHLFGCVVSAPPPPTGPPLFFAGLASANGPPAVGHSGLTGPATAPHQKDGVDWTGLHPSLWWRQC